MAKFAGTTLADYEQQLKTTYLYYDPAEAVARLFRCAFPPFYDGPSLDFTLSFLERLVARVPVRELQFTLDRSVVDLVLAA